MGNMADKLLDRLLILIASALALPHYVIILQKLSLHSGYPGLLIGMVIRYFTSVHESVYITTQPSGNVGLALFHPPAPTDHQKKHKNAAGKNQNTHPYPGNIFPHYSQEYQQQRTAEQQIIRRYAFGFQRSHILAPVQMYPIPLTVRI